MKVIKCSLEQIKKISNGSVLTVGMFDGLHKYHKLIINKTCELGNLNKLNKVILTFDHKPTKVNEVLISESKKIEFIKSNFDIDLIYIIEVNDFLIKTTKEEFVKIIKDKLNVIFMVEGSDFKFGYKQEGNIQFLQNEFGKDNIFVFNRDTNISSSRLKQLINEEKYEEINKELEVDIDLLK
ncbi:hypothetical protein [Mesoplasma chauliocola]|nr:hypothetical protein [Mesoplasma chauliocola]